VGSIKHHGLLISHDGTHMRTITNAYLNETFSSALDSSLPRSRSLSDFSQSSPQWEMPLSCPCLKYASHMPPQCNVCLPDSSHVPPQWEKPLRCRSTSFKMPLGCLSYASSNNFRNMKCLIPGMRATCISNILLIPPSAHLYPTPSPHYLRWRTAFCLRLREVHPWPISKCILYNSMFLVEIL
jgi:hypothetical protein